MRRSAKLSVALLAVAAVAGSMPTRAAAPTEVRLEHFRFGPERLVVPAGTTVHFANLDPEVHTVVSVDGLFRSPGLDQGEGFTVTLKDPGTYRIVCSLHPQMTAIIEVTPK